MKTTTLLLLLLSTALTARADNWIANGDFSNGMAHWRGHASTPADLASSDPFAKPDPFLSQGLIIQLKHLDWAKLEQDFRTKSSTLYLAVTYKVSPDLAFSTKTEDYINVPAHINYGHYQPFNLSTGNWMVFLADLGGTHGTYFYLTPKTGGSDPQTFHGKLTGLVPYADKTLCLAFPPGTGTIVLLNVSLTDAPDGSAPVSEPPAL